MKVLNKYHMPTLKGAQERDVVNWPNSRIAVIRSMIASAASYEAINAGSLRSGIRTNGIKQVKMVAETTDNRQVRIAFARDLQGCSARKAR